MVKVKICGIRREEDFYFINSLEGIDYLGFILYPKSPRFIDWETLRIFLKEKRKTCVGVFVNPDYGDLRKALNLGIDLIQLHGEERPELGRKVGMERVIRAIRVKDKLKIPEGWEGVYAYLFDTYKRGTYGGTGESFNWELLKDFKGRYFLAGGLNPKKALQALRILKPFALDLSSGVEKEKGVKDHKKILELLKGLKFI